MLPFSRNIPNDYRDEILSLQFRSISERFKMAKFPEYFFVLVINFLSYRRNVNSLARHKKKKESARDKVPVPEQTFPI